MQFLLCPAGGTYNTATARQGSGTWGSFVAAWSTMQVVSDLFLNEKKRELWPFFLLCTLEISSPTCLTPTSSWSEFGQGYGGDKESCPPPNLFPFFPGVQGRKGGSSGLQRTGQERRNKDKSGKKNNAKYLRPNLSLFKNEIFSPQK